MKIAPRAVASLLLACLPAVGQAQGNRSSAGTGRIVISVVVAGTALPLLNSVVDIASLSFEHFTDDSGRVTVTGVPAGLHHVRVRHLGYTPRELDLTVTPGAAASAQVGLLHLAITLERIVARTREPCTTPGLAAAQSVDTTSTVAAVLQQVAQNAEQFRLVEESYPFIIGVQRTFGALTTDSSSVIVSSDTVWDVSGRTRPYAPGKVLTLERAPKGGYEWRLHMPTFVTFAEPLFQQMHCFDYAGIDTAGGQARARVDFRAVDSLQAEDVDGAIFLDTATFQVVRVRITVTNVATASPLTELAATTATLEFREIAPSIVLLNTMTGRNMLRRTGSTQWVAAETQEQHIITVRFLHRAPSGLTKPPPV
jgi:hypothetical protein